jgi:hypothetical protein
MEAGGQAAGCGWGRTYNKSYVKHHLYRAACAACAVRRMKRTEAGIAIISSSYVPSSGRRRSHSRLVGNLLSPRSSLHMLIARRIHEDICNLHSRASISSVYDSFENVPEASS